jgi:hypothetical protein
MTDEQLAKLALKHFARYEEWSIDLKSFAAEVRANALEEAANHITRGVDCVKQNGWIDAANERLRCAEAIRELKEAA